MEISEKKRKREDLNIKKEISSITKKQLISLLQSPDMKLNKRTRSIGYSVITSLLDNIYEKDIDIPSKKETCTQFCSDLTMINKSKYNNFQAYEKLISNYIAVRHYSKDQDFSFFLEHEGNILSFLQIEIHKQPYIIVITSWSEGTSSKEESEDDVDTFFPVVKRDEIKRKSRITKN